MTEDVKRIVDALRFCTDDHECQRCEYDDLCLPCYKPGSRAADLIEQLTAELEQVRRERDAAVEDLRGRCYACANARSHKKYPNLKTCEYFSIAVGGYEITRCDKWQWRSPCAENGGVADA